MKARGILSGLTIAGLVVLSFLLFRGEEKTAVESPRPAPPPVVEKQSARARLPLGFTPVSPPPPMSVKEAIERLYDWDDIDAFLTHHLRNDWLAYANEVDALADADLRRAWINGLSRNVPVEDAPAFLKWSAGLGPGIHRDVLLTLGRSRLMGWTLKPDPDLAISYSQVILATRGLSDPNTEAHAVAGLLNEHTPNNFETNVLAVKNLTAASGSEELAPLIVSILANKHAPDEVITFAGKRPEFFEVISWSDVFGNMTHISPAEALLQLDAVDPSIRPIAYRGIINQWRASDPDGLAMWLEEIQLQQ